MNWRHYWLGIVTAVTMRLTVALLILLFAGVIALVGLALAGK